MRVRCMMLILFLFHIIWFVGDVLTSTSVSSYLVFGGDVCFRLLGSYVSSEIHFLVTTCSVDVGTLDYSIYRD